jgi:hypothetical protein
MRERGISIEWGPATPARSFWLTLLLGSAALAHPLTAAAQAEQGTGLAVSPSTTPAAALLDSIPSDASEQLFDRGWTLVDTPGVEDEHFDGLEALVLFEQPKPRVLRLLSQTARQKEYRADVKSIETIEYYDNGSLDEHRMRIMFVKVAYRVRYQIDFDTGRMSWRLDPDFENSLQALEGFWEFYELDDERTLARFGTAVEVAPALPAFVQDMVTRTKLPGSIEHCRKWVNSDGTYRP